jgi:hypothetical protein
VTEEEAVPTKDKEQDEDKGKKEDEGKGKKEQDDVDDISIISAPPPYQRQEQQ